MATGKIKTLYEDQEETKPIVPKTKVKAVSDDNNTGLDVLLERKMPKAGGAFTDNVTAATVAGNVSGIRNITFYNSDGTAVTENVIAVKCYDK